MRKNKMKKGSDCQLKSYVESNHFTLKVAAYLWVMMATPEDTVCLSGNKIALRPPGISHNQNIQQARPECVNQKLLDLAPHNHYTSHSLSFLSTSHSHSLPPRTSHSLLLPRSCLPLLVTLRKLSFEYLHFLTF